MTRLSRAEVEKEPVKICCPRCAGRGKIDLPRHLSDTLAYVRENGPVCTSKVREALMPESGVTGANNRLADLELLGMVECAAKINREKIWKAKSR